jgi:hypothetical protein
VAASYLLRDFFAHPSGVLRELPKDSGRFPEGFPKKTIKGQETNTKNIYFTEPLHTLCNFAFPEHHFCHANSVSGIGDDCQRKIIFSMIPGKNDFHKEQSAPPNSRTPAAGQNCALSLYFNRYTDGIQALTYRGILLSRTNSIIFSSFTHTFYLFFSLLFDYMKRIANNVITGVDRKLNLYYYYSPFSGKNIVRRCSSLTGECVKKDAAFRGFRERGNRMKEVSPIAASLYKLVPIEIKQYSLYRLLTGEALKMLKAGKDLATITETLKQIYIDPILHEPVRGRVTRYFPIRSHGKSRLRSWRGSLKHTTSNLLEKETMPVSEQTISVSDHPISIIDNTRSEPHQQNPIPKTKYPELIYQCRLRECKKLKLWIRSSAFTGGPN